jgi:hypothetical protein
LSDNEVLHPEPVPREAEADAGITPAGADLSNVSAGRTVDAVIVLLRLCTSFNNKLSFTRISKGLVGISSSSVSSPSFPSSSEVILSHVATQFARGELTPVALRLNPTRVFATALAPSPGVVGPELKGAPNPKPDSPNPDVTGKPDNSDCPLSLPVTTALVLVSPKPNPSILVSTLISVPGAFFSLGGGTGPATGSTIASKSKHLSSSKGDNEPGDLFIMSKLCLSLE